MNLWITIFAFFGAVMAILILGFLLDEFLVWADQKYRHKIWEQKYKHRFDKSPTAACYCKDCTHYGGKTFGERCFVHEGWRVADNWFCWEAEPREHDPEEEKKE